MSGPEKLLGLVEGLVSCVMYFIPHFRETRVAVKWYNGYEEPCTVVAVEEGITADIDYDALGYARTFTWFGWHIGSGRIALDE